MDKRNYQKPFLSSGANAEYIIQQLVKRGIPVRKAEDDRYEIYYKGQFITTADAGEAGAFLNNNFRKTERTLQKEMDTLRLKNTKYLAVSHSKSPFLKMNIYSLQG